MTMDPETNSFCISRVMRMSGKVEFRGVATIEGEAEGEITGEDIEIAPSATVTARITVNSLKIAGQVDGEIVARQRVELLPTARLRGTINTPTLLVAEGAQFNGHCSVSPQGSPQAVLRGVSLMVYPGAQTAAAREDPYSNKLR